MVEQDKAYFDKLEAFMNSIDINGFQFHELEEGKVYQWKPQCGPQPLDKIEEIISYRGQDVLTYYFAGKTHLRTSELVNPKVDWAAMNEACRQSLLRIYSPLELRRYLKHTKFGKTFSKENCYFMALLQIIFAIYDELTNAYGKVLENDVTHDAYFVKTCYMKNGEMTGDASLVLNIPFEDWLKKYGMEQYRKMNKIPSEADVVVLVNKDLCDGDNKLHIPYAASWKELL